MYLKESAITLPVDIDWQGNPLEVDFRFILQLESNLLSFGAKFPKECVSLGEQGQFLEGLWEESVVELFIYQAQSTRYVEFNLSPTGAFWCAEFSDYRVRKSELKLRSNVEVSSEGNFNTAVFQVDIQDLFRGEVELTQTAILSLNKANSSKKLFLTRKFARNLSAQEVLKSAPDFHKRELAEVL